MPLPAFGVLIMAIVYFLKLWSYAHANRWYRDEAIRNSREQMRRRGSRRIRSLSVPTLREIDEEETKMGLWFKKCGQFWAPKTFKSKPNYSLSK